MPNYCSNALTISGDEQEVERFASLLPASGLFAHFLPEPVEMEGYVHSNPHAMTSVQYDWRVANWGTKWDIYEWLGQSLGHEGYQLEFDTAWSPPIPVIKKMSEDFPELMFGLAFDEPGNDFGGFVVFKNGEVLDEDNGESKASTWADSMENVSIMRNL